MAVAHLEKTKMKNALYLVCTTNATACRLQSQIKCYNLKKILSNFQKNSLMK